jgi:hypothetical protein
MARRREPHRPLTIDGSHWRADGQAKRRYPTAADAKWAAAERSEESDTELGVYRCDFCGGWHMGKRTGRSAED